MEQTVVELFDIEGTYKLSGVDKFGNLWVQFYVDYFAEESPGICIICGQDIEEGWTCVDSGEEICNEHIKFDEKWYEQVSYYYK